ncbi:hypothetical protein EDB84DRAFT_1560937 [Lactarius hengduanensis]|nr:hypothetical protein EDB84DRAFT_1560937 [Lactarius hengduanensis]
MLTYAASPLQIWCTPVKGAGRAPPRNARALNSWLEPHGGPSSSISTTHGGSWLTLTGVPVSQANELLGASYQLYWYSGTGDLRKRRDLHRRAGQRRWRPLRTQPRTSSTASAASLGHYLPGSSKSASGDLFLEWFKYLTNQMDIPQMTTTSVGIDEKDLPLKYATAVCDLFLQLGTRGVGVIFASGDDGASRGHCTANGSRKSSPCSLRRGFSIYFPRRIYQNAAVPTFIQHFGHQYNCFYNPAGRGVPNDSAQALGFVFVGNNKAFLVNGASASGSFPPLLSVTLAGIILLLNDYRLLKASPRLVLQSLAILRHR